MVNPYDILTFVTSWLTWRFSDVAVVGILFRLGNGAESKVFLLHIYAKCSNKLWLPITIVCYKRSDMIGHQRIMTIKDATFTCQWIVNFQRQNDVMCFLITRYALNPGVGIYKASPQSLLCARGVRRFHTFFYGDYATRYTWLRLYRRIDRAVSQHRDFIGLIYIVKSLIKWLFWNNKSISLNNPLQPLRLSPSWVPLVYDHFVIQEDELYQVRE